MRSKSSFKEESSIGSICSVNSGLTRWLFLMTYDVIIGATTERAAMTKSPSRRVWPTAKDPPEVMLSLIMRRAINPYRDGTVELTMKAPMSVSKPADLG